MGVASATPIFFWFTWPGDYCVSLNTIFFGNMVTAQVKKDEENLFARKEMAGNSSHEGTKARRNDGERNWKT